MKLWADWNSRVSMFAKGGPAIGLGKYKKDAIDKAVADVAKVRAKIDKAMERKKARTRCPRNRYRKKEVVDPVAMKLRAAYRIGGTDPVKSVAVLGRPRRKRVKGPAPVLRTPPPGVALKSPPKYMQLETVKAAACVHITPRRGAEPLCRVDTYTLERKRPYVRRPKKGEEPAWSQWNVTSTEKQPMLCDKLK